MSNILIGERPAGRVCDVAKPKDLVMSIWITYNGKKRGGDFLLKEEDVDKIKTGRDITKYSDMLEVTLRMGIRDVLNLEVESW